MIATKDTTSINGITAGNTPRDIMHRRTVVSVTTRRTAGITAIMASIAGVSTSAAITRAQSACIQTITASASTQIVVMATAIARVRMQSAGI
jgi:hypothetical protein